MTDISRRAGRSRCNICGEPKSATQMGNHIAQELEQLEGRHLSTRRAAALDRFLHVEVQHQHARYFWMHLLVRHETSLGQLDAFLRAAWLECCGHLSRFDFHGLTAYCPEARNPRTGFPDDDDEDPLIGWNTPAIRAMPPGMTGVHEYDFGSTTRLQITSRRSVRLECEGSQVMVIARNSPVQCDACGRETATVLTPTPGVIADPSGQLHQGIIHTALCGQCPEPAPTNPKEVDQHGDCSICDAADYEDEGPVAMANSPRLYDAVCFDAAELAEAPIAPQLRPTPTPRQNRNQPASDKRETNTNHGCEDEEDSFPGLDPILDNVARWPNVLIMDSLLESAARFNEDAPPPEAIIRALDGLEKLAMTRTLGEGTGDHHKYFDEATDWTYTAQESPDAMAAAGDDRRFQDGGDVVIADATLSWNEGNAIFMIGHLDGKGTLLAYFGPNPTQPQENRT